MELESLAKTTELGKKGSYKIWMDAGYSVFSKEGVSGIQVEGLARLLNKNKSGFYHFFGDRSVFLEKMMKEHLDRVDGLVDQIRGISKFDPEYLQFMLENKETVLFQMQLVRHREEELFAKTFRQFNARISNVIEPVWSDYLGLSGERACTAWAIIRDSFYARITPENFNYDCLSDLAKEVRSVVRGSN